MKRLTESDRQWFLNFLKIKLQEEEFNVFRYKTESTYENMAKLKKIYNILKHEYESHSDDPLYKKD